MVFRRGKTVEELVISGMHSYQLPLQMRGKLGDFHAGFGDNAFYFISIILTFSGFGQVYATAVPGWDLHRSEEHTSELQSLMRISYAVFCLKKKKIHITIQ